MYKKRVILFKKICGLFLLAKQKAIIIIRKLSIFANAQFILNFDFVILFISCYLKKMFVNSFLIK